MQATTYLALDTGLVPRILLNELKHPDVTQDSDQALDQLVALNLLQRDGSAVILTQAGYDFRDQHPADMMVWIAVYQTLLELVERLVHEPDLAALKEVGLHLRALTDRMLQHPDVEALLLTSLLAVYLHKIGAHDAAIRYAKELEALEKQLGGPRSNVVQLLLYGDLRADR